MRSADSARPLVITSSGTHTLSSDLTTLGPIAVRVDVDHVALDLSGHTIRCASPDPRTAVTYGVHAEGRKNITIQNGNITGCFSGVHVVGGRHVRLEGVNFSGNTYMGANLGGSTESMVRGCVFADISGYTGEAYAVGLNAVGSLSVVECNVFLELYRQPQVGGTGEGVGVIVASDSTHVVLRHNCFANAAAKLHTIGIWVGQGTHVVLTRNSLTNFSTGVGALGSLEATDNRFLLRTILPGSVAVAAKGGGRASWNVVEGYETAFSGAAEHDNIVH